MALFMADGLASEQLASSSLAAVEIPMDKKFGRSETLKDQVGRLDRMLNK
jgi:hypothetical protein